MMRLNPVRAGLVVLAVSSWLFAGTASAKPDKVELCHLRGDGTHQKIEVSARALGGHLRHGDLQVGIDVDDQCEPFEIPDEGPTVTQLDQYTYAITGSDLGDFDGTYGLSWFHTGDCYFFLGVSTIYCARYDSPNGTGLVGLQVAETEWLWQIGSGDSSIGSDTPWNAEYEVTCDCPTAPQTGWTRVEADPLDPTLP